MVANLRAPRLRHIPPRTVRATLCLLAILAVLLTFELKPYDGNLSSLLHIDRTLATDNGVPAGTLVLTVPGYDGMEYYQIARNVPKVLSSARWDELRGRSPGAYAYQRFLLPALAFFLALGNEQWLPASFLAIELLSIALTFAIVLTRSKKLLPAYALALCPATMVALHFSLAEPLTILLLTAFLTEHVRSNSIDWIGILLLSLAVLSREIVVFFALALLLLSLWQRKYRDAALLALPLASFVALHSLIYAIFREVPFLLSTGKSTYPLQAIIALLGGQHGYNHLTLTSIPLFLFFVLPATISVAATLISNRRMDAVPTLLAVFLCLMLLMPDHIWGSITSIGRVITPVYPLFVVYAWRHPTRANRLTLIGLIIMGVAANLALASVVHPFTVAG